MNDSTLFLIVALCGLGVVILGLIVFVFSILFRFTGRNFVSFLAVLLQNRRDDSEEKPVISRPRPNLRAKAEAQDFDAALAKHIVQDEGVITNTQLQAQANPPAAPPPGFEDVSSQLSSRRRRIDEVRRKSRSDEDADLFGSLLDDDE